MISVKNNYIIKLSKYIDRENFFKNKIDYLMTNEHIKTLHTNVFNLIFVCIVKILRRLHK